MAADESISGSAIPLASAFESRDVVSAEEKFLSIIRTHRQYWTEEERVFVTTEPDTFLLASLFANHVCGYKDFYYNFAPITEEHEHTSTTFTDRTNVKPYGIGTIRLKYKTPDKKNIYLENILYLPGYANVLSINAFVEHGKWKMEKSTKSKSSSDFWLVYEGITSTSKKLHVTKHSNGMFKLTCLPLCDDNRAQIKAKQNLSLERQRLLYKDEYYVAKLWHLRLGHIPWEALNDLFGINNEVGHALCEYCDEYGCNTKPYKFPDSQDQSVNGTLYVQITEFSKAETPKKFLTTIQDKKSGFAHSFSSDTIKSCIQKLHACLKKITKTDKDKGIKTPTQQKPALLISCTHEIGENLDCINKLKIFAEPVTTHTGEVEALVKCENGESKCHMFIQSFIEYVGKLLKLDMDQWDLLLESATTVHNSVIVRETDKMSAYAIYHGTKQDTCLESFRALGCRFLELSGCGAETRKLYTYAGFTGTSLAYVKKSNDKRKLLFKDSDKIYGYFFEEELINVTPNISKTTIGDQQPFDDIFYKLKSFDTITESKLTKLLEGVHELLTSRLSLCQNNLVSDVSDIYYPFSNVLREYKLDILDDFLLFEIQRDANSLFAAVSVTLFGHANCWQLLKILVVQHVLSHWTNLEAFSEKIFGVGIKAIVDGLTSENPTIMHVLLIATMINRPIYVLVFNQVECTYSLEYIFSAPKPNRDPIFLCHIDNVFYPCILQDYSGGIDFVTECYENKNTPFEKVSDKYACAENHAMCEKPIKSKNVAKQTIPEFDDQEKFQTQCLDDATTAISNISAQSSSVQQLIQEPEFAVRVSNLVKNVPLTLAVIRPALKPLMTEYMRSRPEVSEKIQELSACLKVLKRTCFYSTGYSFCNTPHDDLATSDNPTSWETTDEENSDDDTNEQSRSGLNLSESSSDSSDDNMDESNNNGGKVLRKYRRQCAFAPACKTECSTVEEMKAHYITSHGVDKEYGTLTGNTTIMRDRLNKLLNVSKEARRIKSKQSQLSRDAHNKADGAVAGGDKNTLCQHCCESFFTQRDVYKHIQKSHYERGRFACRFCIECLLSRVAIMAHEKLEHSTKYLNELK